jgi:hypothetical protein
VCTGGVLLGHIIHKENDKDNLFVVEVYPAPKEVKVIISRITLERRKKVHWCCCNTTSPLVDLKRAH